MYLNTVPYFKIFISLFILILVFSLAGCDENYTPRPRGFFRIELPEKKYTIQEIPGCHYEFETPQYARLTTYSDSLQEPCWKYLGFPTLNAEIFLSYKMVNHNIADYIEDARTLAYKHAVKADAIDETLIETPNGVYGLIYDIGGSAASSIQFYATDSVTHFLRGALYFNEPPRPDSLAPVIQFIRQDIERMLITLRWK